MTTEPRTIALSNGTTEPEPAVRSTFITLKALEEQNPIALYEAVAIARDPAHEPFGNTGEILREYSLLDEGGQMYDTTRNTILSAVKGDDLMLRVESPFAWKPGQEALAERDAEEPPAAAPGRAEREINRPGHPHWPVD